MLINLSNHPSALWAAEQKAAAVRFGEITDLPFPEIDPDGDEANIQSLAKEYLSKIDRLTLNKKATVHVMGEMTFTFAMVKALQEQGITCVASTTERIVTEENGIKTSEFQFVKFREYNSNKK